jgi:TrmH family RNA methyltransferase
MAVKAISSRDNPLLLRLRKLAHDPTGYRRAGQVWLEGEHLCQAFVQRGGVAAQAVVSEAGWEVPALRALADTAVSVAVVPAALMAGLSTLESPPSLAFAIDWQIAPAPHPGVATVVLDRLQDPGNVGTVLRSAAAFGFGQVVALKLVEDADAALLQTLQLPLLATSSHATQAIHDTVLPWPCAWVLGHEGQGVAALLLAACAMRLRIPQPGGEESLNVAAAAAVCLYESARQRAAAQP